MKKSLKILSFVFATILFAKTAQSQNCDLKPEEIPDLKKMTLIVETQSEAMNTWFSEFWTFNTKIEFKTEKEIRSMKNSENYIVLGIFYDQYYYTNELGKKTEGPAFRALGLVELNDYPYIKTRNNINRSIVSVYTPYNEKLENTELRPFEFKLSVKILSNLLKTIEKQQIKNYKATKFAKDQADTYCEKISTKEIFFDKALLKQTGDINELKRNKKLKVTLVNAEQIAEKVDNEEDVLVSYSAPYAASGPDFMFYVKILINAKTGNIYFESGVKLMAIGMMPGPYFTKSNLKDIVDCIQ